jgi:hypothetical protein
MGSGTSLLVSLKGAGAFLRSAVLLFAMAILAAQSATHAATDSSFSGFTYEATLSPAERLDAIRFLQARIIQPERGGSYLVRGVSALHPKDEALCVFAYLVTFQTDQPERGAHDLGDLYSVSGYYLVMLTRRGDGFTVLDEFPLTQPELAERLNLKEIPPPPELTADPELFDFTAAVFDAMDPSLVAWREELVARTVPRWEWVDLTDDGLLDCVLDIEGFVFQPTSYYTVLVSSGGGFIEGFRSWGHNTDFLEFDLEGGRGIEVDRYAISDEGTIFNCWRDYFRWDGNRFAAVNRDYASEYEHLVPALEDVARTTVEAETDADGRWDSMARYEINATRYHEGLGVPFEYFFSLARIADYQGRGEDAMSWWAKVVEYINHEYDTEALAELGGLDEPVRGTAYLYEEWRDELYAAAEAALEGE